jgi:hypothetical protein
MFVGDPTPSVFVVASLAGGTGCGILLDTLFLLNQLKLEEGLNIHQVFAYLFLPNLFYATRKSDELAERSYGNAYAALKELDHYAKRFRTGNEAAAGELSIDYLVEWEPGKPKRIPGPPADAVYLLEMENEGGVSVSQQNRPDLFSMLAECLYLDLLPGAFANDKRSDYSNVTGSLAGLSDASSRADNVVLPQRFSRRYATCGLSKIEIPVDQIRGGCAAKLACEIFDYILREREDANVKADVRNDLATARLDADGISGAFGGTWKEVIQREIGKVFSGGTLAEERQIAELEAQLVKLEDQLVRSETADRTKLGDTIQHLRGKTPSVIENSKKDLNNLVRRSCLESEGRGLRAAVKDGGYLHQAIGATMALHAPAEQGIRAVFDAFRETAENDAGFYGTRKKGLIDELRNALKSRVAGVLGTKDWTLNRLLNRLRDAEEQYLLARAAMCQYDESKKVAVGLAKHLGELHARLDRFEKTASAISGRLKERQTGFFTFRPSTLFIQLFDAEHDLQHFYRLDRDDENGQLREVNPPGEYARMLARVESDASLLELVGIFEREGEQELEKRSIAYCEDRFLKDFASNPRLVNVLDHPVMKARGPEMVQQLVNAARPMLRQAGKLGSASVKARRVAYLGISDPTVEPFRSIVNQVDQLVKSIPVVNYELQAQPTKNPSEVYLYFSNFAYTLPALPLVSNDCHEAYSDFYAQLGNTSGSKAAEQTPLHLSKRWEGKFDDLKVYSDAEAKVLAEVYSSLVLGIILKVLSLKEDKGLLSYQYRRGLPYKDLVPLGPQRHAVGKLRRDDSLRAQLTNAVKQREADLKPEQVVSYYWALQAMLRHPEIMPDSPEHTLLSKALEKTQKHAGDLNIPESDVDPGAVPVADRLSYVRGRNDLDLEWTADLYPALKSLPAWERSSAGAWT